MRKLKLLVQVSADGYMADADGKTDWMIWNWGDVWGWNDALQTYFTQLTGTIDTVLLSRKMAVEGFVHHWQATAARTGDPQAGFATHITIARKVVFTKTLKNSEWDNTVIENGDLVAEVNKLKQQEGKDIIVYGGSSFLSSLITAGLIDEYYLFINPVALGSGLPVFPQRSNLSLVDATPYSCGMVVQVYKPG